MEEGQYLKKDEKIELWLCRYKEKHTINNYQCALKDYCAFTEKSPTQLINEVKEDIKAGLLMDERRVFSEFLRFNAHLAASGVSTNTQLLKMSGVRSFFKAFYIDVPDVTSKIQVEPLKSNIPIPTKADIQDALEVCDPLEKAVMLTGIASGLSAEEICSIRIETYREGYDPATEIATLRLTREKRKVQFITYLTPEATRAVNKYLAYRERVNKTNDPRRDIPLSKQRITKDGKGKETGYLFILQHVPDKYLETGDEELRKINPNTAFMQIYRNISNKAQMSATGGNWNLIRSHNLRKYFNSVMLNNGADSFFVEFLMGHKQDKTRAAYFRASPEKYREIYAKYIPYLTIQKELDVSVSPVYKAAIERAEKAEAEAYRVSVERNEVQQIKDELIKLRIQIDERGKKEQWFRWIIAGETHPNETDEEFETDYNRHRERYRNDAKYKEEFDEYERVYMAEEYGMYDPREADEYHQKTENEKKAYKKTLAELLQTGQY